MKAVIFDLYGTLMGSSEEFQVYKKLFSNIGLDKEEQKKAKHIALTENFNSLEELKNHLRPNSNYDTQYLEYDILQELASVQLFPETMDLLKKLKKLGIKTGVISNLATPYRTPAVFIDNYIDEFVFSCDEGIKKPDPKIYQMMLDKLGVKASEAFMVGDSVMNDYITPTELGIKSELLIRPEMDLKLILNRHFK
ncbi:MAG: HAD-IA family hydrolase [archaeon]